MKTVLRIEVVHIAGVSDQLTSCSVGKQVPRAGNLGHITRIFTLKDDSSSSSSSLSIKQEQEEILCFIFGIFGNATALFLFLSPLVTFRRIIKTKPTQQSSGASLHHDLAQLPSLWMDM
ncbi:hypothetical protein MKW98_019456 [Papaver atlanticum]|uniref:Uncharacterized protein n=1 Tax=Papaver atlanticum TaxID=357466 RepID=A0AAD4XB28_9MAGN|nr:hypothetical protein MKW98_019456 [Papaver atlanticum]